MWQICKLLYPGADTLYRILITTESSKLCFSRFQFATNLFYLKKYTYQNFLTLNARKKYCSFINVSFFIKLKMSIQIGCGIIWRAGAHTRTHTGIHTCILLKLSLIHI